MKDSGLGTVHGPARRPAVLRYNIPHFCDIYKHFPLSGIRVPGLRRSRWLVLTLLMMAACRLRAAEDPAPGCRWQAMAGAGVAGSDLNEAPFQNPASLAGAPPWRCSSTLSRPYGLAELSCGQAGASRAWPATGIAAALYSCGSSAYREITAAAALGHAFTPGLVFGVTLRYLHIAIARYGAAGALLGDLGGRLDLTGRLSTGFCLRNLGHAVIGRCHEPLPQSLQCGLAFALASASSLCADLYFESGQSLAVRCGAEHRLGPYLALRAGFNSAARRFAAGFGLHLEGFSIEYSATSHPWLGLTHQFGLTCVSRPRTQGRGR